MLCIAARLRLKRGAGGRQAASPMKKPVPDDPRTRLDPGRAVIVSLVGKTIIPPR
jgi:hypothetical protein